MRPNEWTIRSPLLKYEPLLRRFTHADRIRLASDAMRLLRGRYGRRLLAVGLYGSTARFEAGPYSDVELTAIVGGKDIDRRNEGIVRRLYRDIVRHTGAARLLYGSRRLRLGKAPAYD